LLSDRMPRNACRLLLCLLASIYFQSTVSKTRIVAKRAIQSNPRRRHSGRLLGRPDPVLCARRPRTVRDGDTGHFYFFSEDTNYRVSRSAPRRVTQARVTTVALFDPRKRSISSRTFLLPPPHHPLLRVTRRAGWTRGTCAASAAWTWPAWRRRGRTR